MAKELISGELALKSVKHGSGRVLDGSGLYLLPAKDTNISHAWRFDYSFGGRRKTISLGTYPAVTLKAVREKARRAREQVAAGTDPSADRQAQKAVLDDARNAEVRRDAGLPPLGSFEEVARRWFAKKEKNWTAGFAPKVIRRLELHVFPYIGARPVAAIRPPEVLAVCRRIEDAGTLETAHRALEHCSNVFRFSVAEGVIESDPCRDLRGALATPVSRHFAAIKNPRELAALLRATYAYHGTAVVRAALKLAPMFLLRPGELRGARWDEIDLDNGIWYIPLSRMKLPKIQQDQADALNERHFVPLCRQAVGILEDLFLLTGRTGFVFPAEGRNGRTMSNGTINAALRVLGFPADVVTGHGFRATARTLLDEVLEFEEKVIEMQLGHMVKDENGRAYNRTEFIVKRQTMMQAWADYLDELREDRADYRQHAALPEFTPVTKRFERSTHSIPQP